MDKFKDKPMGEPLNFKEIVKLLERHNRKLDILFSREQNRGFEIKQDDIVYINLPDDYYDIAHVMEINDYLCGL